MLFSAPKSKHHAIGRTAKQSPLVRMNGVPIPQVRTLKHLGLIFNNTLTWNDHVSNGYSTRAPMLGILRRLDGNISLLCMERIYITAIRSRMEYACAVWSGGSTRSLQRLQDSFAKRLGLTLPPLKNRFNCHTQGWKNFSCATRHNGTTPKKSVAKLEPGLKTWSPKQNTKANNCKTVQKKHENCRYT